MSDLSPSDLAAIAHAEEVAEAEAARPRRPRRPRVQPTVMHPSSAVLVAARRIIRDTEALIAAEEATQDG